MWERKPAVALGLPPLRCPDRDRFELRHERLAPAREPVSALHVVDQAGAEEFGEPGDEHALTHAADGAAQVVEGERPAAQFPEDAQCPATAEQLEQLSERAGCR